MQDEVLMPVPESVAVKFRTIDWFVLRLRPFVGYWIETLGAVLSIVKLIRDDVCGLPALSFAETEMLCFPSTLVDTLKVVLAQLVIVTGAVPSREYVQDEVLMPVPESVAVKFRAIDWFVLRFRPFVGYLIETDGAVLSIVKLIRVELPWFPTLSFAETEML